MALQITHNDITFRVGDTVRVHYRIIEREKKAGKTKRSVKEEIKERVQPYEGVVISIKGADENKAFTVRHIASNQIGMERVFPIVSPWIEKIEVKREGMVRRSKLYYLRNRPNLNIKKRILQITPKKVKSRPKKLKSAAKPTAKKPSARKNSAK
jgi:large subunit ribosomal protein L19